MTIPPVRVPLSARSADPSQASDRSQYVTLCGDTPSSPPTDYHPQPPFPFYSDDSDGEDNPLPLRHPRRAATGGGTWWNKLRGSGTTVVEAPQSGYLTLIPLSDSRLKPQHTKLLVGTLLFLTLVSVCFVYFAVARGVTVGSIEVVDSTISFNTSQGSYQLVLWTQLPIYNPNYAPVLLTGRINVSFYDQQAGFTDLQPVLIPARAQPEVITVDINSSSVPHLYLFTIYTQCFTFPERLIFFLSAELKSQYLGTTYALPRIDNYAIVGCQGAQKSRDPQLEAEPGAELESKMLEAEQAGG